jgi:hypothetical protein
MLTNLISPTRQKQYTLEDILSKGLIRSGLTGEIKIDHMHTCFYGSKDFYVYTDLACTASLWSDSVCFNINGIVPIHATKAGKLQYGFGCGCDSGYGPCTPNDEYAEPGNPDWACYQDPPLADITFWSSQYDADTSERHKINLDDIPSGDKAQDIIVGLIKAFLARQCFAAVSEREI